MRGRVWKLGLVAASGLATGESRFRQSRILRAEEAKQGGILPEHLRETITVNPGAGAGAGAVVGVGAGGGRTDQCILVVGTTGSGKSSTIAKLTGQDVTVGSSVTSVTRSCQLYPTAAGREGGAVWIDTVGYDDTACLEDEESFKDVLRYMAEHGLLKVAAVVWTVLPQERRDARLQRQAEFIDQFRGGGRIWDNVVIIAKQPGSFNLERAVQGAREAAKLLPGVSGRNIQSLGFTYLDSSIPEDLRLSLAALGEERRREMLLLTTEEVVEQVEEALGRTGEPVQVVFEDSSCSDCGVVGDRRLLPQHCHMEQLFRHPGALRHFHQQPLGGQHPLPEEAVHPGVLRLAGGPNNDCLTVRNTIAAMIPIVGYLDPSVGIASAIAAGSTHCLCRHLETPLAYTFTCCQGSQDSPGCRSWHPCCRRSPGRPGCAFSFPCCGGGVQAPGCERRYQCCDKEEGTAGCSVVCKKCGQDWGSPAGDCYKRKHNLRAKQNIGA